ncbi:MULTISPECIES: helix-turn-helix domain-containing protein [unclassified Enterococcus]|nr:MULTISPECIES: AraC family transcriptional regulator [unclassified Enterococcus]MBK0039403.1 helix-turn-helix transcriptional regulator [Enterococcus sp. S52]MBK0072066.1 helix-turn-helix transcriptional regulator [Enterococcus sp. S53]MBK0142658.1 helix-turn-helix transcriptional regulator [Enterococcus sp. S76]MBK0146296.1 helix-turn-helix transcriptional regulator [Enterococcus sp. S77]
MPNNLEKSSSRNYILKVGGLTVLENFIRYPEKLKGRIFLEDHLLLLVLSGTYKIYYGNQIISVEKNQMVLLKKSIVIEYEKLSTSESRNIIEYWMFFIDDDLLMNFAKESNINVKSSNQTKFVEIQTISDRLLNYLESLRFYFRDEKLINNNLIKLKLLELLYDLEAKDESLIQQMLNQRPSSIINITPIIEANLFLPVTLSDLSYLCGRSLSSFKRDFYAIYNMAPSTWIRERRINKAKELLDKTSNSITDICFTVGFENLSHFSKVFKKLTGYTPISYRQRGIDK